MAVISAYEVAGGIQINEVGADLGAIECRMVMPDDPEWPTALQWTVLPLIQRSYYDGNGQIIRAMQSPDIRYFDTAPTDLASVEGFFPRHEFYIENGTPVPIPENPTPGFEFNFATKEWEDMRTVEDWLAELAVNRAMAVMSRVDFVLAAAQFQLLSHDDAELAIEGKVPPTFQGSIDAIPEAERFEAVIRWKGATEVERLNPLILAISADLMVSEWNLDLLFGVKWPAPLPDWDEGRLHV